MCVFHVVFKCSVSAQDARTTAAPEAPKMSFADDKLYNGYLRRNMAAIVTRVRVREIIVHLPCLTQHDREIIEAKREISGNYNAMSLLLDCLKRRENWPEQFIDALEACEQSAMAAEIRAEYNALRGINNPSSSPPPATVTRAHVHPAPAAVAPPPANPPVQVPPPLEVPAPPQVPQSPAAQAAPSSEPEPSQSPPPSTPPPSPETPRLQVTTPPHPQVTTPPATQKEVVAPLEPEENSESDVQEVSDDEGVIPDQVSSGNDDISLETPQSPSPTCMTVTDGSSTPTLTPEKPPVQDTTLAPEKPPVQDTTLAPEKPPVQDTTPPVDKAADAVLQPQETSEPPQDIESHPQTQTAAAAAGMDTFRYEDSVCLSKPGQLISIHPQTHSDHTNPAPSPPLQPYSGNSDRLEISEAAAEVSVPVCSPISTDTASTVAAAPCLENGIDLDHNEPEENSYESPGQSLDLQDVQENVVHVAEEPSILNLDGQSSATRANGEAPKETTPAPPTAADTGSGLNQPSSAPQSADTAPELKKPLDSEKSGPRALPANTKYILTAAGVGACALLIAWRFKN